MCSAKSNKHCKYSGLTFRLAGRPPARMPKPVRTNTNIETFDASTCRLNTSQRHCQNTWEGQFNDALNVCRNPVASTADLATHPIGTAPVFGELQNKTHCDNCWQYPILWNIFAQIQGSARTRQALLGNWAEPFCHFITASGSPKHGGAANQQTIVNTCMFICFKIFMYIHSPPISHSCYIDCQ